MENIWCPVCHTPQSQRYCDEIQINEADIPDEFFDCEECGAPLGL